MFDGNDGAAARDFRAHEFRRDEQRHRSAEALAVVVRGLRALEHFLAAEIFALGDVDHFLGDDARARPFELGEGVRAIAAGLHPSRLRSAPPGGREKRPQRLRRVGEIARQVLAGDIAVVDRLDRPALILLDAAALAHPFDARARQALLHVDRRVGIGIGAGRIVDRNRRLAGRRIERNLAQRHFQLGRRIGPRIDLARAGDRAGRDLRRCEIGFGEMLVHRCTPGFSCVARSGPSIARRRTGTLVERSCLRRYPW